MLVRISWETEQAVRDWARDHYPYCTPRTFDEIIKDLVEYARYLEKDFVYDRD